MKKYLILLSLGAALFSGYIPLTHSAWAGSAPAAHSTLIEAHSSLALPSPSATPTVHQSNAAQPTPTQPASGASSGQADSLGPDTFPPGVNPLTGLKADNPDNLKLPPALISVTNFPASARPQAGLGSSALVFEMWVGEGMSRFLALFYGDYPTQAVDSSSGNQTLNQQIAQDAAIGPVRSGRLPYESVRKLYNGFLVMASAYSGVAKNLSEYTSVYGSDSSDVNSAMIPVDKLEQIAQANQKKLSGAAMSGMRFTAAPPSGGAPGSSLWMDYSFLNQAIWRYDKASGAYNRYQNDTKEGTNFNLATDRLTGQPLAYENVVVLFANHTAYAETLIDIDLLFTKGKAILLRDGQKYDLTWTTLAGDYEKQTGKMRPLRFTDANGQPAAFKPGQTWVIIVTTGSRVYETADTQQYYGLTHNPQPGSGHWAVLFAAPPIVKK